MSLKVSPLPLLLQGFNLTLAYFDIYFKWSITNVAVWFVAMGLVILSYGLATREDIVNESFERQYGFRMSGKTTPCEKATLVAGAIMLLYYISTIVLLFAFLLRDK